MKTTPRKRTPRKPAPENKTSKLASDFEVTKIDHRTGASGTWVCGRIHGHRFEALVFPEHAENPAYEIGQSKITKLWVQNLAEGTTVYNWDRGRDVNAANGTVAEIVEFLYDNLATRAEATTAATAHDTLTKVAADHLGLETLATRNSDGLDFHDLSVWQIAKALDAAYRAGQADAKKRPQRK